MSLCQWTRDLAVGVADIDFQHKELFDKAWSSKDVIEAQVARIEKRAPNFIGA